MTIEARQRAPSMQRRDFLTLGAGLTTAALLPGAGVGAQAVPRPPSGVTVQRGRRRLGALEVSSIGLGVQNMTRTYPTLVPSRPEMLDIIRTAFDLGIGFVPWSPLGVGFLTGAIDARTRFAPGDIRGVEPRFSPENLPNNLALVEVVKSWAERKQAAPGQIALAWLLAQKPWIVPIPGTTQMAHMLENTGAADVRFSPAELAELNVSLSRIEIRGQPLPDGVLSMSGVEAPKN